MSSSVSRSSPSLHASSSTLSGEAAPTPVQNEESLLTEQHWKSVVGDVVQRHYGSRYQALAQVHARVLKAAATHDDFPEELETEFRCAAEDLAEAMMRPEMDFRHFEEKFVEVTTEVVAWHNREAATTTDKQPRYGGPLGRDIFDCFIGTHTIAVLTACLRQFHQDTHDRSYDVQLAAMPSFLRALFDVAAQHRHLVARMSATKDAEKFGAKYTVERPYMVDTFRTGWNAWSALVSRKVVGLLEKLWRFDCLLRTDRRYLSLGDFVRKNPVSTGGPPHTVFLDPARKCAVVLHVSSELSGHGFLRSEPRSNQISYYRFTWSVVQRNGKEGLKGDLRLFDWECFHPATMDVVPAEDVASYVKEALALDGRELEFQFQLKSLLGAIEHIVSHSSTWVRGQASISKMLIEAIALFHGHELTYSEHWSSPKAQLDQHALSEFDPDRFVADAVRHLKLTPVDSAQ